MRKSKLLICLFFLSLLFLCIQAKADEEVQSAYVHIINYDKPLTMEEIKTHYTAYDSIDGNISEQIILSSDYEEDLNNHALKVQVYPLVVSITNSRGIKVIQEDAIDVRDFTAPIVTAKESEISLDLASSTIEQDILEYFIFSDNYDTDFENIRLEGIENLERLETCLIYCSITDSSGNLSNVESIIIHPYQSVIKKLVTTSVLITDQPLTAEEIIQQFINKNSIPAGYQNIHLSSHYLEHPDINGIYQAKLELQYEDGVQYIYQFKIDVAIPKQEEKSQLPLYISFGCLVGLSLIGVFIYRKRR